MKPQLQLRRRFRDFINGLIRKDGYEIIESRLLYPWQNLPYVLPSYQPGDLPSGAVEYLTGSNPRLLELQERYRRFNPEVTAPLLWQEGHVAGDDIRFFRGDNAYVWQLRGLNMNVMAYALTAFYVQSLDKLDLWNRLQEDTLFGNYTFNISGKLVSRDLLDSIIEIHFLDRHLGLSAKSGLTVLDIGAGYGRMAHRMSSALPGIQKYLCTDGVAVSTFICDYYTRYRGLSERVSAVPLDEIEAAIETNRPDLAINIHSFSECQPSAINWWIALLRRHSVKHLFIVPNSNDHGGKYLRTNDGRDFQALVESHGYRLKATEPKYLDATAQLYGINPTHHFLFELA